MDQERMQAHKQRQRQTMTADEFEACSKEEEACRMSPATHSLWRTEKETHRATFSRDARRTRLRVWLHKLCNAERLGTHRGDIDTVADTRPVHGSVLYAYEHLR